MGVSAVFVSALALTRLPEPMDPPANQAQLLAATIQPIVSFVVLGSIIVRPYHSSSFVRQSERHTALQMVSPSRSSHWEEQSSFAPIRGPIQKPRQLFSARYSTRAVRKTMQALPLPQGPMLMLNVGRIEIRLQKS